MNQSYKFYVTLEIIMETNIDNSIVTLDIGGRIFKTRKETLMNAPYFQAMFGNNFKEANDDNDNDSKPIFIDRNPNNFEWILEVLRTGEANDFQEKYIPDLEFFGIDYTEILVNSLYDPIKNVDEDAGKELEQIVLTHEQKVAKDALLMFMRDTHFQVCLLEGYAGVGKTTVLSKTLLEQDRIASDTIAICAPTHKAKNILETKIGYAYKATTLHKLFCLIASIDDNGKVIFTQKDNKYKYIVKKFNLIVVDECSMISEEIFEIILKVLREFPRIKMIVTGDPCQLPPINEVISKTFSEFRDCRIKLTNVVRHAGGILDTATLVRKQMKKRHHKFIESGNDVRFVHDDREFLDFVCYAFREKKDAHVITWTNKRTNFINGYIRKALFGDISEEQDYIQGEQIIVTDFFDALADTPDEDMKIKYYTCDVVNLFDVTIEDVNVNMFETLKCYKLFLTEKTWIYKVHKDDKEKYDNHVKRLYRNAKAERNKTIRKGKWEIFHKFTKTYNAPVNYNYSTTCHKAQGSTYTVVFVDLLDMYRNRDTVYMNKCMYTAITRASKMLIMFL